MKTIAFLILSFVLQYQVSKAQTVVIIEGGADAKTTLALQEKSALILKAINGNASFPDEAGVENLKQLISEKNLFSPLDTIGTVVIKVGKEFELPRFFLQKVGGKAYETTELVFRFDSSFRLVGAQESSVKRNIDRILSRNLVADASEQATIEGFIQTYISSFNTKNLDLLRTLFNDESTIIVGTKSRNFNGFDIVRNDIADYLDRTGKRTFVAGNKIELSFESPKYLRHPDLENVYGFTAKQNWTTTSYSDVGYIFIIVDHSNASKPFVELRQWQENEFVASRFSDVSPDPWFTSANLIAVEQANQSELILRINSTDEGILSAGKANQLLQSKALVLEGIEIVSTSLSTELPTDVLIAYTLQEASKTQEEQMVTLKLKESGTLKALQTEVTIYPNKRSVIELQAVENEDELVVKAPLNPYFTLNFEVSPDSVQLEIKQKGEQELIISNSMYTSGKPIRLFEGEYTFTFAKQGYVSQELTVARQAQADTSLRVNLALEPIAAAPIQEKAAAKIVKPNWWIWGSAAILTGGAIAYFLSGDSASPGIPVPPGRPVGM